MLLKTPKFQRDYITLWIVYAHVEEVFYLHPDITAWKIKLINHVDFFNQTHTQVIIGGKHNIM